jgi:flagellar motor protein MotB
MQGLAEVQTKQAPALEGVSEAREVSKAPAETVEPKAAAQSAVVPETRPAVPARLEAPAAATPKAAPTTVDEVYRRRLAEFNAPVTGNAVSAAPSAAGGGSASGITLIPPSEYRRKMARDNGGAQPLAVFDGSKSAASFEVGVIAFGEGTAELSPMDRQRLKDIVGLFREKGAALRVIGHSASPRLEVDAKANRDANRQLATARAATIARELIKLGAPARKIFAGGAEATATNAETTEIVIDY